MREARRVARRAIDVPRDERETADERDTRERNARDCKWLARVLIEGTRMRQRECGQTPQSREASRLQMARERMTEVAQESVSITETKESE